MSKVYTIVTTGISYLYNIMKHKHTHNMKGLKKSNIYASQFGEDYNKIPKAVFAAIAYSFAELISEGKEPKELFMYEWDVLHQNHIVPQKPIKTKHTQS